MQTIEIISQALTMHNTAHNVLAENCCWEWCNVIIFLKLSDHKNIDLNSVFILLDVFPYHTQGIRATLTKSRNCSPNSDCYPESSGHIFFLWWLLFSHFSNNSQITKSLFFSFESKKKQKFGCLGSFSEYFLPLSFVRYLINPS